MATANDIPDMDQTVPLVEDDGTPSLPFHIWWAKTKQAISDTINATVTAALTANWSGVINDNGHRPADDATKGATWGTDVNSRPVELTDGRVAAGLNSSGGIDFTNVAHTNKNIDNIPDGSTRKALQTNAVQTSHVQNNAITNTASAYTASSVVVPATSTWTDIQSVTLTTTGAALTVDAAFYAGAYDANSGSTGAGQLQWQVLRDSTVIFGPVDFSVFWTTVTRGAGSNSITLLDQPAAGSHTYKIQAYAVPTSTCAPIARSLVVQETKK